MPATAPTARSVGDRCPGVLRPLVAQDGLLARVRLPGGLVSAAQLHVLADAAEQIGDGRLELTSRGNVQVRGMSQDGVDVLAGRLTDAGLLPTPERDLVRNMVASPLSGLDSPIDLTPIVRTLDLGLRSAYRLDSLSGRFLFAIDDGRGDVGNSGADLVAVVGAKSAWVEGVRCAPEHVAGLLIEAATAFVLARDAAGSTAWHVDELAGGRQAVRRRLDADPSAAAELPAAPAKPLGRVRRTDGSDALVVAPPLGRLTAEQARWIAAYAGGHDLRVTPWRSVVLPTAPPDDPAGAGLVADTASPWHLVTSCAGRPGCGKAHADVQRDAAASLGRWTGRRVHWSGCERCCGRTADVEVDAIATPEGYRFSA